MGNSQRSRINDDAVVGPTVLRVPGLLMNEHMSVEGIINLNKPAGMSSAQAVYRLRRLTRVRKSGHAGTLDPRATGVLVICIGRATKLVESVMNHPKIYRTTARLDVTNETLDLDSPMEAVDCATPPSRDEIEAACRSWEGRVQQMPPLVSAIKYGGLPAYERVRRNESVVLVPRWIDIYWIHLRRYAWPEIEFDVCSGRGTYVRSLVRDLGAAVGAGGVITQLRRDRVGPFTLANAASFECLESSSSLDDWLTELDRAKQELDPSRVEVPARPSPALDEEPCGDDAVD